MNDNPTILHSISLEEHNFIVSTLDRNPLQVGATQVANLIKRLNATAQAAVDALNAPPEPEPAPMPKPGSED